MSAGDIEGIYGEPCQQQAVLEQGWDSLLFAALGFFHKAVQVGGEGDFGADTGFQQAEQGL